VVNASFWQVFLSEFSTLRGMGKLVLVEQRHPSGTKWAMMKTCQESGETGGLLQPGSLPSWQKAHRAAEAEQVHLQSAFISICILKPASGGPPALPKHCMNTLR